MTAEAAYKMSNASAQAKHGLVSEALSALVDGKPPKLKELMHDALLSNIVHRFGFFVRAKSDGKSLFSGDALRHIFLVQSAAEKKGHTLNNNDISQLRVFQHFVPDDIARDAEELVQTVAARDVFIRKREPPSTGRKRKRDGQDGAVAEAMAMFSNS